MRLLFYCHNVFGLGHIARTVQVARAAVASGRECALVTGCRHLDAIPIDPAITVHRLPPVLPRGLGYVATEPGLADVDVMALRSARLVEIFRDFCADAAWVDHQPLGLSGELLATLQAARAERWPTRFVWGLPYLEGTLVRMAPPGNPRIADAVAHFSSVIGCCDATEWREVEREEPWALPSRRRFVGLIGERPAGGPATGVPCVVVLGGGGSSSEALIRQVLDARRLMRDPRTPLRIVAGPMADPSAIAGLVGDEPALELVATASTPHAIAGASAIVGRAGYNTAGCVMQSDVPVVFVPARGGSNDQVRRAERLAGAPGVWVVAAGDPAGLATALDAARAHGPVTRAVAVQDAAAEAADWLASEACLARSADVA